MLRFECAEIVYLEGLETYTVKFKKGFMSLALLAMVSLSGCGNCNSEFAVINDENVVDFVKANVDRAGSAEVVNSDLDLTVKGRAPVFKHEPNAALPEPYKYILVMCLSSGSEGVAEGRVKNTSPVMFGIGQSKGDPAFKLSTNSCTVSE